MDEEIIIIEDLEENNEETTVDEVEVEVEQDEMIEYIEAEETDPIEIEMTEQVGWTTVGDGSVTHSGLLDKDKPGAHLMSAISGLEETLHKLSSISTNNTKYSTYTGIAEFRQWLDNGNYKQNYSGTGGVGYFVSLVRDDTPTNGGNIRIDIAGPEEVDITDIYGVTVANSGFCGNQSSQYDLLYPEESGVMSSLISVDLSNSPQTYAKVCLLGDVQVRVTEDDYEDIQNHFTDGVYVVPGINGHAKRSENNVGFKVINMGSKVSLSTGATAWYYVEIALVPQNDNVARVVTELKNTQGNLVVLGGQVSDLNTIVGTLTGKVDDLDTTVGNVSGQLDSVVEQATQAAADKAQEIATTAETTIQTMVSQYSQAVTDATEAKRLVDIAGDQIDDLIEQMEPIATWVGDDGSQSSTNFVNYVEKNAATLGNITQVFGDNGSNLTAFLQKIDENETAIQMLASHTDKYIFGPKSPTSYINGTVVMQSGTVYVCSEGYTEQFTYHTGEYETDGNGEYIRDENGGRIPITQTIEFTFDANAAYTWGGDVWHKWDYEDENTNKLIISATIPTEQSLDGDLWPCYHDISMEGNSDIILYDAGTLYRWTEFDSKDENGQNEFRWVSVAKLGITPSSIGLMNIASDQLTSIYTDLNGKMSVIEQDAYHISTTVVDEVQSQISQINQTAKDIMMGVHDKTNSTSLGLLLGGMMTTSTNIEAEEVDSKSSMPSYDVDLYIMPPKWDGEKFVFGTDPSEGTQKYFFEKKVDKDGNLVPIQTYYCQKDGAGYKIYGVNNLAMTHLGTRVSDTESAVESWTRFQKGQDETISSIEQLSNAEGASISSMVYGDFRDCTEVKMEFTDSEDDTRIQREIEEQTKYKSQPEWDATTKTFVYDSNATTGDKYCLGKKDEDSAIGTCYYKLLYRGNDVAGYEKYEMKSSPYATIFQEINEDGTSAGLITSSGTSAASIVAKTINNGASEIFIDADKINIDGSTEFYSGLGGATTISGDLIRTGVLQSENYVGPATYKLYGVKIEGNKIVESEATDCIWYAIALTNKTYELSSYNPSCIYYTANSVKVGMNVNTLSDVNNRGELNCYIIGTSDFDLVELDTLGDPINIIGTKFDLNNGTIFSKHFSLDRDGDLTIVGRITATSGYIGNNQNGFTIDWAGATLTYTVDENGLQAGDYYFKHSGAYYQFTVPNNLFEEDVITLSCDNLNVDIAGYIGTATTSETIPYEAIKLSGSLTEGNHYYLSNGQTTYGGNDSLDIPGVYLGPDGIGLGNGNFYVDNKGDLTAKGNILLEGNITLGGNIKFLSEDSNISWSYLDDISQNASNANTNVKNLALGEYDPGQNSFINKDHIYSPNIIGGTITGGSIVGGEYYDTNKDSRLVLSSDTGFSDLTYYRIQGNNNVTELFQIWDSGTNYTLMKLYGNTIGLGGADKFMPQGIWDFKEADVRITFG